MPFSPPAPDEIETADFTPPGPDETEDAAWKGVQITPGGNPSYLDKEGKRVVLSSGGSTIYTDKDGNTVELPPSRRIPMPENRDIYGGVTDPFAESAQAAGLGGRFARATLADIGNTGPSNAKAAIQGVPLPIDQQLQQVNSPALSTAYKFTGQAIETAPKMAAVVASGPAAPAVAAIMFGFDDQGNFHPGQAALAAALPGASKLAGEFASSATAGIVAKFASRLKVDPTIAQNLVNAGGRYATANAALAAQSLPGWSSMNQEQKEDAVAGILSNGVLGLADFGGYKTESGAPDVQKAIQAFQDKIDQGKRLDALAARSRAIAKPPPLPQAAEALNAVPSGARPEITYDDDLSVEELQKAGVVAALHDVASDGGDVIKANGQPAGWMKVDDDGVLQAIEIKPEFKKQGIARQVIRDLAKTQGTTKIKVFLPTEQGRALLSSLGKLTVNEHGEGILDLGEAEPKGDKQSSGTPLAKPSIQPQPPTTEEPNASRQQETAKVHGDVQPQPVEGQGNVPVPEGQRGVQPSPAGRVQEGTETPPTGPQPETLRPAVAATPDEVRAKYPDVFKGDNADQIPVEIKLKDGTIVPGVVNGIYDLGEAGKKPSVAKLKKDGVWSHGMLGPGEEIVSQMPTDEQLAAGKATNQRVNNIKRLADEPAEAFTAKERSGTAAIEYGRQAKTPHEIEALRAAEAKSKGEFDQAKGAARFIAKKKQQFFTEALREAQGQTKLETKPAESGTVAAQVDFKGRTPERQKLLDDMAKSVKNSTSKGEPILPAVDPKEQRQPIGAGPGAATAGVPGEGAGMPTIEDQISGNLAPARTSPPPLVSPTAAPAANGMLAAIKSGFENVRGFIGGLAGKTFPRITLKSKELGELGARWISSRIAARPVAEVFAADVLGNSGIDPRKYGAALTEDNLRSIKKAFDDRGESDEGSNVHSLIGQKGSPFKTEEEYQAFLNDPKVKEAIARHIDLWKNVVEPQYKQAMSLDPDLELPSRGLQTGARINLKAVLEDEPGRDAVSTTPRGSLLGTLKRKSPFGVQARGTGEGYHVNYYDLMENTFGRQLEIANKNAFEKAMVEKGQAVIAPPGERVMIEGRPAVPFPLKRRTLILSKEGKGIAQNQNIYVNSRLATEYRIAANVDMKPPSLALRGISRALNTAAIASGTDATTHMLNLTSTLMTLPGTSGRLLSDSLLSALPGRPDALVSVSRALVKGFQDNRAQLASLAEIGALKEQHEATRVPVLRQVSQAIQWLDRSTRLALDDSYQRLAKDGLVENSETARREFINQVGQYNKRAQGFYKRFFRDSGLGPFVTAGTTFNTLGVRAATLNPGVKASSLPAAMALRANMAAKIVGTVGTIATLNYLLTKDKPKGGALGRPGVPLGAIDLGTEDKNGRPKYIAILNMISAGRGLRALGVRGFAQAKLQGLPNEVALDSGARDMINSVIAPWAGPTVRFGVEATTGYPTALGVGRATPVVPPGHSQHLADFKEAIIQASPVTAGIEKSQQPGSTGLSEILKSQLPRFAPQPGKPAEMMNDYPAIVRRAQANGYIDDVIGRARKMEPAERQKFLQDSVNRLDNAEDKEKAWREFRYRKVMK